MFWCKTLSDPRCALFMVSILSFQFLKLFLINAGLTGSLFKKDEKSDHPGRHYTYEGVFRGVTHCQARKLMPACSLFKGTIHPKIKNTYFANSRQKGPERRTFFLWGGSIDHGTTMLTHIFPFCITRRSRTPLSPIAWTQSFYFFIYF